MMQINQSSVRVLGIAALLAGTLVACDATETNPVREDGGPAHPATESTTSGALPPTVAPPSGVDLSGKENDGAKWTAPDDHKLSRFLGMVADKPATWIEHPPATSMELTRFTVPGRDGSPAAEIVVFYFGNSMGGSVDENISRWQNQFRPNEDGTPLEPDVSTFAAGEDIDITLVELEGEWMRMGAASFTPDQQFVAAIVECPRGPLYIRFVGDKTTVGPNRDAFVDMMKSLRADDASSE